MTEHACVINDGNIALGVGRLFTPPDILKQHEIAVSMFHI